MSRFRTSVRIPIVIAIGITSSWLLIARRPRAVGHDPWSLVTPTLAADPRGEPGRTPPDAIVAPAVRQAVERLRPMIQEGRYADAEKGARELLSETEATYGRPSREEVEVLAVLVESLWRGGRATAPDAAALAERAVDAAGRIDGAEGLPLATSLINLGNVLLRRDDFSRARSSLERALAIQETILGPDRLEIADTLNSLSVLHGIAGDYQRARPPLERALAIRLKALGPDHPDVAIVLNNLGILLTSTGDYDGARVQYERTLAIREKELGPDHPLLVKTQYNLAILLTKMGDSAGARALYERALRTQERVLGPDDADFAASLSNLADILAETGDYAAARPLQERAVAILERKLGPNHSTVAEALASLALMILRTGDEQRSRALYERSIGILERTLGPWHPTTARTLSSLARLLEEAGDYAGASRLDERALLIREKALGPRHPDVAESLDDLGGLSLLTGDHERARSPLHRALEIQESTLGPAHPRVGVTLNHLARLAWAAGDAGAALDKAVRAERIFREHFERTARYLAENEALRYEGVRVNGLDMALTVLASRPESAASRTGRARVWDEVIGSRGMVLDEMAWRHRVGYLNEGSDVAALSRELRAASTRLATLVMRGPDRDRLAEYKEHLAHATQEKDEAERRLAEKSAGFRSKVEQIRIGLADVKRVLPRGSALLAFVEYNRTGRPATQRATHAPAAASHPAYLAFVLRPETEEVALRDLGDADHLEALIRHWREPVASAPAGLPIAGGQAEARYRAEGERLRRALWDPLAPWLEGRRQVFLVPDGAVNLVDFATLPVGQDRYLAEEGPTLHYLSAERDLVRHAGPLPPGRGIIALGGADFDARPRAFAPLSAPPTPPSTLGDRLQGVAESPVYRSPPASCLDSRALRFDPLPETAAEAAEVTSLWTGTIPGVVIAPEVGVTLTGPDASEEAFKRIAPGSRILHLATHGFFLEDRCESALSGARARAQVKPGSWRELPAAPGDNPLLLTGLALAGANRRQEAGPGQDDGILTAEEIASLDLSGVEWAVLSACQTGMGRVMPGEGILGLRRAFEVAGAGALIISLWRVEDGTSREWMRRLHGARVGGLSTPESVREASVEMIASLRARGRSTHPFFWGGFVAAGGWR